MSPQILSLEQRAPAQGPGSQGPAAEAHLSQALALAFAPMHKSAFGVATGTATALVLALVTAAVLMLPSAGAFPLHLIAEYFAGYSVTWPGVAIGAAWAFAVGFVAGWFAAFCRNFALAIAAFFIRARAELSQTRDFLDHI